MTPLIAERNERAAIIVAAAVIAAERLTGILEADIFSGDRHRPFVNAPPRRDLRGGRIAGPAMVPDRGRDADGSYVHHPLLASDAIEARGSSAARPGQRGGGGHRDDPGRRRVQGRLEALCGSRASGRSGSRPRRDHSQDRAGEISGSRQVGETTSCCRESDGQGDATRPSRPGSARNLGIANGRRKTASM
jgi:hypothetical protein